MLTGTPRLPIRPIISHGWLPSPLKKLFYRLKGYRIGSGVSLGFGSVVLGRHVEIGERAEIGFFTIVRGTTIRIGAHVQIGAATILDTPHLEIGDGTRINEQVFVGGLHFPDSKLVIGRNCQIMQMSFINPARSITVGDDTGIGGDCLLFGHTSWLSRFEGYPVEFDSIEIGNNVSLAWRVFVLPGTRIGDGAVVGANSLVKGTIPPRCLAVGFPARVVSKAPEFPRPVSDGEKETLLNEIVAEMIVHLKASGFTCRTDHSIYEIVAPRRKGWLTSRRTWRLAVESGPMSEDVFSRLNAAQVDVFLSLRRVPEDLRHRLASRGSMWIDIESKEREPRGNDLGEEVAQYLRRYGVRLVRANALK